MFFSKMVAFLKDNSRKAFLEEKIRLHKEEEVPQPGRSGCLFPGWVASAVR